MQPIEQGLAGLTGKAHAVATVNGTAGLHLSLIAAGVGADDLVAVPDWAFVATANAVRHAGATPLLVDVSSQSWTLDPELLAEALAHAGLDQPATLADRVQAWRGGAVRALSTAAGRKAFEEVLPALLAAFSEAPDQAAALNRCDDLLRQLPSTVNVFRLLQARPALMRTLVDIRSHAPTLAESLARRGDLLDGLIDASAYDLIGTLYQIVARLSRQDPGRD